MLRLLSKTACSGSRFVRAGDGPLRFGRISRSALAALVLSLTLPLALLTAGAQAEAPAAETPVTVQPAEVATALFVAGDITRLSNVRNGTEELVLEKALQQLYADEPALAPATAESYVADMKASLTSSSAPSPTSLQLMAGNQRIIATLAALERPYGSPAASLPAPAKLAVTHLAAEALSGTSDIFADAESPKYFEPQAYARTNLTYTTFAPATVLRKTHALAGSDRAFGEARDAIWAKSSEESVFSDWSELLSESKVLGSAALKPLREEIEAGDGSIATDPTTLAEIFTKGQKTTQEQSCEHAGSAGEVAIDAETIGGIPPLECSGGALYEAARVPRSCPEKAKCEEELENLESQAAKQAKTIAEERAVMTAAGELLRPSDNTAAQLEQATTQAQSQITEEEKEYASYEAEQAQKAAIAGAVQSSLGIASAALAFGTDNYSEGVSGLIGVAFELYEHTEEGLQKPPPGPQEITLQDLADLSTQLAGFQEYTQEAFHALNTQLASLSSQLARENYELKAEIGSLAEKLESEQSTIFALQGQVKELFAAETKANLQATIEDSVGWLMRTGEPPSGPKIQESLVALKKYATEIANGALVNNAETEPYTFEGAGRQLTSKVTGEPSELSEDISYLGRFPREQGWSTAAIPTSLANTTFWSESSLAYAQLMLENPAHATSPDVAGLKALENEGVTLQKAVSAWTEDTAGGKTGNKILNEALGHFEEQAYGSKGGVDGTGSIEELLEEAAGKYLEHNLITGSPKSGNPTDFELWKGAKQSFSASSVAGAEYPALKWEECSGSAGKNGKQQMPESFIAGLPVALVNAVRLGVVGAAGSGDPLILSACRTITKTNSVASTQSTSSREGCKGFTKETCELEYEYSAKLEKESETTSETITLKEGEGGSTLASPSVGECDQTALYWTGRDYVESVDPTDKELNGDVAEEELSLEDFSGRHVGSVSALSAKGDELSWLPDATAFEGAECPHSPEAQANEAGLEFADYDSATKPLGSTEPKLVEEVEAKLRTLQEGAYSEGLGELKTPPKGNPAASLAGARALVQSYVKLGFPQALASDPALESDIEGTGAQFLDPEPGTPRPLPEELTGLVESWIRGVEHSNDSEAKPVIERNLIGEVEERSSKWAAEVATQIKPYVEDKVQGLTESGTEAVDEQSPLVESTLDSLQLTRDVLAESRAPSAETLTPDSDVGISEATVRGEVSPNGGVVESCVFEYGSTEFYGHSAPCSVIPPPGTEKAVVVSATIANWTPEGSFHERVVLKTWGGTSYGEDVKVQLAQSTQAPAGLVMARTDTPGATIGGFTAEELPAGIDLPSGAKQIVGSLSFSVNVTPGGTARVDIELPEGSAPTALYKLVTGAGGGKEYKEIPASLYTIKGNVIELTLVDGGPDDEDGTVNGVIVDPLVPVVVSQPGQSPTVTPSSPVATPLAPAIAPPTATIGSPAEDGSYAVGVVVKTRFHCTEAPGGPGIASCVDSGGASNGTGELETAKLGLYTYTVTAKSHDGQSASATIHYAVVARHECVSDQRVTLHVAYHVSLPPGTSLRSSTVLRHEHVVAKLHGPTEVAVLSFAGQRKGPYEVTLIAKLSNGETRKSAVAFHSCVGVPKPEARKPRKR